MKIQLLLLGKTTTPSISELAAVYIKKLQHYCSLEIQIIDNGTIREEAPEKVKDAEAKLILKKIKDTDTLVLLDENGKTFDSVGFANQIQNWMNSGAKQIVFVVGGPFGFHKSIYERAQFKISLSSMTMSHQLIRPVFLEQLYRSFTILRNEPYHHK
jgi:23S rRNA (pseudouridine1915-N3)-methyltransferase